MIPAMILDSVVLPAPDLADDAEDLAALDIEADAVDGTDNPAVDGDVPLHDVAGDQEVLAEVGFFKCLEVGEVLHEPRHHLGGRADRDDLAVLEQERPIREVLDHVREVRGHDHAHALVLDRRHEHAVDDRRRLGVERARGLVGKEQERLLGQLPGKDDPLLLAAGEVAGDMHHAVAEPDLVEEVGGTADGLSRAG